MQYKNLSVAGCAALLFGLFACSGDDGINGKDGVNGLNGTSCNVSALKDGTGYKVLCGGDSVGVLLNGKNGAKGAAGATGAKGDTGKTGAKGDKGDRGEGCSVAALPDNSGYDVYCGANKVGVIKKVLISDIGNALYPGVITCIRGAGNQVLHHQRCLTV